MAIKSSGDISFDEIVAEFGGTAPHAINEYYRGGAEVGDTAANSGIPTAGAISLSNFYSASDWSAPSATGGTITDLGGYRYHVFSSSGSFIVTSTGDISTMEIRMIGAGGGGGGSVGNNFVGNYKHGSGGLASTGWSNTATALDVGTYTITIGASGPAGANGSHDHECSNPGAGGLSKIEFGALLIHNSAGGTAGQSCHRSYSSCPTAGANSTYGTGGAAGSCGTAPSAGGAGGTGAGGGGAGSGYYGTNWGATGGLGGEGWLEIKYQITP